jgi:hypothetical protein
MGVACASCGHLIPSGQFRCSHCGAAAKREDSDDYGGLLEATAESPPASATALEAAPLRTPPADDDDGAGREPLVPRGTFASELPDRGDDSDEREAGREPPAKLPEPIKANEAPKAAVARASANPASGKVKTVRAAARPPFLASEILREDLTPSEPGKRLLDVALYIAPALGILATLLAGLTTSASWVALVALTGLLALARFELPYATRALLVAVTGGGTLALIAVWGSVLGARFDRALITGAATLLPASLYFRAWYRGSEGARVLVASALVLALAWAMGTSDRQLLSLVFSWQSWLPALTWYLFALLCLFSLLAFMGAETTGGCDIWAVGVSVWYALFATVRFALETQRPGAVGENLHVLGLLEPALAAPTSIALAQLLARSVGARAGRRVSPA